MFILSIIVLYALFSPTIVYNNNLHYTLEYLLYIMSTYVFFVYTDIRGKNYFSCSSLTKSIWTYFLMSGVMISFFVFFYRTVDNDLYILRTLGQATIFMFFVDIFIGKISPAKFCYTSKLLILIATLPSIVTYLQAFDVFGFKAITDYLYKPDLIGKEILYLGFRFPSVFNDYFTASVYFYVVSISAFYFYLQSIKKSDALFFMLIFIR